MPLTFNELSDEQQEAIQLVRSGSHVRVNATVGSGKTTCINIFCQTVVKEENASVLYLTYSKMLKEEAKKTVTSLPAPYVTNYHAFAYRLLSMSGISTQGVSDLMKSLNENWDKVKHHLPSFKYIVLDEYQDLDVDTATLVMNLKKANPFAIFFCVGDPDQKISSSSTLNAHTFISDTLGSVKDVSFTYSFRIGPKMAKILSQLWKKPIRGLNEEQSVEFMTLAEATDEIMQTQDPSSLFVIGPFKNSYTDLLNDLETARPLIFNPQTVYANIYDRSRPANLSPDIGIMTTFDSTKGMERDTVYVLGFTQRSLLSRQNKPFVDPRVIRNLFGVAASRGKKRIVFVWSERKSVKKPPYTSKGYLGYIHLSDFDVSTPEIPPTMSMGLEDVFNYKFKELVDACLPYTNVTVLRKGTVAPEELPIHGTMSLAPVFALDVTMTYFDDQSAQSLAQETLSVGRSLKTPFLSEVEVYMERDNLEETRYPWRVAKASVAVLTNQRRYLKPIKDTVSTKLFHHALDNLTKTIDATSTTRDRRVAEITWRNANNEPFTLNLNVLTDAIDDAGSRWHLTCASDIDQTDILACALDVALAGGGTGFVTNILTGELLMVSVNNPSSFITQAIICATSKQALSVDPDIQIHGGMPALTSTDVEVTTKADNINPVAKDEPHPDGNPF